MNKLFNAQIEWLLKMEQKHNKKGNMLLELLDFLHFTIYYFVFIYNKIESHSLNHYKLMSMFSLMPAQPPFDRCTSWEHGAIYESIHTHTLTSERQAIVVT